MPNATVLAAAPAMPKTADRRGALCAVLAAGAVRATAVLQAAAASRAMVAPESCEDAALLALLNEARAVEVLENEINDAESAAHDRMIRPDPRAR
jgi:hypothetical protein